MYPPKGNKILQSFALIDWRYKLYFWSSHFQQSHMYRESFLQQWWVVIFRGWAMPHASDDRPIATNYFRKFIDLCSAQYETCCLLFTTSVISHWKLVPSQQSTSYKTNSDWLVLTWHRNEYEDVTIFIRCPTADVQSLWAAYVSQPVAFALFLQLYEAINLALATKNDRCAIPPQP